MPDLAELDELLNPLTNQLTYVVPFFPSTTDVVFTEVDHLAHLTRDVPGALTVSTVSTVSTASSVRPAGPRASRRSRFSLPRMLLAPSKAGFRLRGHTV